MARTDFKSVDAYLASQPAASRAVLRRVRGLIRGAAPRAEETISYQIPTYKLDGERLIYFAGWKQHYSLYPATAALVAVRREGWRVPLLAFAVLQYALGGGGGVSVGAMFAVMSGSHLLIGLGEGLITAVTVALAP